MKKHFVKGMMIGLACALFAAAFPSLTNMIEFMPKEKSILTIVSFTMVILTIAFFIAMLVNLLFIGPKKYFGVFKKYWKNKDAWKICVVNLLGTPLGAAFMIAGVSLAGGALGKAFIALCIPLTAILERILIKRKFLKTTIIGLIIMTISAIFLGVLAVDPKEMNTEVLIGIIFCLGTAFSWSIQGVIMYKLIHKTHNNFSSQEMTVMKYSFAFVVQLFIILPLFTLINFNADATFISMGKLLSDYHKSLIILLVCGFVIFFIYWTYIQTTKTLGATMGVVFENLSLVFIPLFVSLFYVITKAIDPNDPTLNNSGVIADKEHIKTWWFWTFSITLFIGIILIIIVPKNILKNHDGNKNGIKNVDKNNGEEIIENSLAKTNQKNKIPK